MNPEVLARLRKIAAMFASSHEGERLAALDRANALLAQHGWSWSEIIGSDTTVADDDVDLDNDIPDAAMSDMALREYADELLHLCDFDEAVPHNILRKRKWTATQRAGLVKALRSAWLIRRNGT